MKPRAVTFIALNAIRIISLVALILAFSASIVALVKDIQAVNRFTTVPDSTPSTSTSTDSSSIPDATALESDDSSASTGTCVDPEYILGSTVPNQPAGVFWAVVNRLLIIFELIALVLSELSFPKKFFLRFFPVLGPEFGVGPLGIFQALIGASILSHHVDNLNLGSAFYLFAVGCFNMVVGLIFRESAKDKRSVSEWRNEKKKDNILPISNPITYSAQQGTLPPPFLNRAYTGTTLQDADYGSPKSNAKKALDLDPEFGGMGWGRKAAMAASATVTTPEPTLPRYTPAPSPQRRPVPELVAKPLKSQFTGHTAPTNYDDHYAHYEPEPEDGEEEEEDEEEGSIRSANHVTFERQEVQEDEIEHMPQMQEGHNANLKKLFLSSKSSF